MIKFKRGTVSPLRGKDGKRVEVPALVLKHVAVHRPLTDFDTETLSEYYWNVTELSTGQAICSRWVDLQRVAKDLAIEVDSLFEKSGIPTTKDQMQPLADIVTAWRIRNEIDM